MFKNVFKKAVDDLKSRGITVEVEHKEDESKVESDEWIWVEGYKGTNSDMTCNGYQYELGKKHDMPEDSDIEMCISGFHFCKRLDDVFCYYNISGGHRFFKVRGLVRKNDLENYGRRGFSSIPTLAISRIDKLVAKSIEFISELTMDEILEGVDTNGWSEEDKKVAISINVCVAQNDVWIRELVSLGYSGTFSKLIISKGLFDVAKAVGSQPDLSMDMKCWLIFNK